MRALLLQCPAAVQGRLCCSTLNSLTLLGCKLVHLARKFLAIDILKDLKNKTSI